MAPSRVSQFDFLRSRYPQAAKDAMWAEFHYAMTHHLGSAGTSLRRCLEGYLRQLHREESRDPDELNSADLRWLIDNVFAPRQGFNELHSVRKLGNRSAHPGNEPSVHEIEQHLIGLHRILAAQFPVDERPPGYTLPTRRREPFNPDQSSQLEAQIALLHEQRQALEEEGALTRAQLQEADQQLKDLNGRAKHMAQQKELDRLEVERLNKREKTHLRNQRELEAKLDALVERTSRDNEARRRLDEELARVNREMDDQLGVLNWSESFPEEDWTAVPAFLENRLMAGQPPFQEWHIAPTLIGEGGFGRVYRCFPSNNGVPVAVKIPRGQQNGLRAVWAGECASARRVAAMFAADQSPSVARPLQVAPEGIDAFITYELVEGKELGRLLGGEDSRDPRWRITVRRALFIIDRIAMSIDELLQAGVRHTDISPRNVILRAPHDPVLIDYAPCLQGDTRTLPPEWRRNVNPQECAVELARSGQMYLLGLLLLRLLGIHQLPAAHSLLSSDVLDTQLVPVAGEVDWEPELASSISKQLESLEVSAREELRNLLLDLLDPDPEMRAGMHFDAVRRVLRRAYDPDQQISAIFAPA